MGHLTTHLACRSGGEILRAPAWSTVQTRSLGTKTIGLLLDRTVIGTVYPADCPIYMRAGRFLEIFEQISGLAAFDIPQLRLGRDVRLGCAP